MLKKYIQEKTYARKHIDVEVSCANSFVCELQWWRLGPVLVWCRLDERIFWSLLHGGTYEALPLSQPLWGTIADLCTVCLVLLSVDQLISRLIGQSMNQVCGISLTNSEKHLLRLRIRFPHRTRSKVHCTGADLVWDSLGYRGLNTIKLAYSPSWPDGTFNQLDLYINSPCKW